MASRGGDSDMADVLGEHYAQALAFIPEPNESSVMGDVVGVMQIM